MSERVIKSKEEMTKKFEGMLMYLDHSKKANLIDVYTTSIGLHNNFISECEALLNRKLTKAEIKKAVKSPTDFAEHTKTLIKSEFQFKSATTQFNLDSMGISFQDLDDALNIFSPDQRIEKYLIDEGRLVVDASHIKSLEEQSEVKTKNQKQTDIFLVAKSVKNNAKLLRELGVTFGATEFNWGRATNQLVTNNTAGLNINYHKILMYK